MPFETPHDSGGTVLVWAGSTFTVTNIVLSYTDPGAEQAKIDVSNLSQTTGSAALLIDRPIAGGGDTGTGRNVQFDYVGKAIIEDKATGTFSLTVGGQSLLSKAGTVQSSTLTLATNEAIRGQATITISR
jgi:hypothetical protein